MFQSEAVSVAKILSYIPVTIKGGCIPVLFGIWQLVKTYAIW